MKCISKLFLSLTIITLSFSPIDCLAKSANKATVNLIKPADPKAQNKDELLKELRPKEEITEFDITTQENSLDAVRALEALEESEVRDFRSPPSKEDLILQDKGLKVAPAELDRLLFPQRGNVKEEDENALASKARLKLKLSTGQQEDLEPFQMAHNQAMVQDLGNGEFDVDPSFERQIPTLIDMNKLAYAIGKRGTVDGEYDKLIDKLKSKLKRDGWEIEEFEGKTGKGNKVDDTPWICCL
ncbi:MAG TPA: hypothetical protein DD412_07035 [Holosporales bacterium]|nr:hypothetical protein [Holosporales bacterium]